MNLNREEHSQRTFDTPLERGQPIPREVVATILFDSLTQSFADARGATDARQIVMRAEEFDIHLKISTNPNQHQIIGQVFARDETRFLSTIGLQLSLNGKLLKTTWSDNFGQFQFDEVPEGVVHLQVDLPRLSIVSGITITDRRGDEEVAPAGASDGQ